MINKIEKRQIMKRVAEIRKNPPKVTQEHHNKAKAMFDKMQAFEAVKDKDIATERKDLAKECASYVHTQMSGVGQLFHGFGEGKKNKCGICKEHHGQMFNMNDGNWYCQEHRWFGNLRPEEQKKERKCLSQKKMS